MFSVKEHASQKSLAFDWSSHRVLMKLWYFLWTPASHEIYSDDIICTSCCQEHPPWKKEDIKSVLTQNSEDNLYICINKTPLKTHLVVCVQVMYM